MRREASTPEGVYSARDIAGQQELDSMERQIERDSEELEVCLSLDDGGWCAVAVVPGRGRVGDCDCSGNFGAALITLSMRRRKGRGGARAVEVG